MYIDEGKVMKNNKFLLLLTLCIGLIATNTGAMIIPVSAGLQPESFPVLALSGLVALCGYNFYKNVKDFRSLERKIIFSLNNSDCDTIKTTVLNNFIDGKDLTQNEELSLEMMFFSDQLGSDSSTDGHEDSIDENDDNELYFFDQLDENSQKAYAIDKAEKIMLIKPYKDQKKAEKYQKRKFIARNNLIFQGVGLTGLLMTTIALAYYQSKNRA